MQTCVSVEKKSKRKWTFYFKFDGCFGFYPMIDREKERSWEGHECTLFSLF